MAKEEDTIEGIRKSVGVLPSLFAEAPGSRQNILLDESKDYINFRTGIPKAYSTEGSGKYITRYMMNAIGNLASQNQFFEQCGGYWTFDEKLSSLIGGYPKDAVLGFYDETSGLFRRVKSLKDDNDHNFLTKGVDGIHWAYCDSMAVLSVLPDYANAEDVSGRLFQDEGESEWVECDRDCWFTMFGCGCVDIRGGNIVRTKNIEGINFCSNWLSKIEGSSYLEISLPGGGYRAVPIGSWRQANWGFSNVDGYSYSWYLESSPVVTGFNATVPLARGDRVRISNILTVRPMTKGELGSYLTKGKFAEFFSNVAKTYFPEMTVSSSGFRRKYLYKFAQFSYNVATQRL